jgi:hypothetical protein
MIKYLAATLEICGKRTIACGVVAASAWLAAPSPDAKADVLQYTFNTSYTGYTANGDYYSLSGSFDYDNGAISNAVISLNFDGGVGTLTAATSDSNPAQDVTADSFTVGGAVAEGGDQAYANDSLTILADGSFGGSDLTIQLYDAAYGYGYMPLADVLPVTTAVTDLGSSVTTPEPASLALLASAAGLLGCVLTSRRMVRKPTPSQTSA